MQMRLQLEKSAKAMVKKQAKKEKKAMKLNLAKLQTFIRRDYQDYQVNLENQENQASLANQIKQASQPYIESSNFDLVKAQTKRQISTDLQGENKALCSNIPMTNRSLIDERSFYSKELSICIQLGLNERANKIKDHLFSLAFMEAENEYMKKQQMQHTKVDAGPGPKSVSNTTNQHLVSGRSSVIGVFGGFRDGRLPSNQNKLVIIDDNPHLKIKM